MARSTAIETSVPEDDEELITDQTEGQADEPSPEDDAEANRRLEAKARRMGWTPFAEFKGDRGRWQPAVDFVARAEEMLPIARALNHSYDRKLAKAEQVQSDMLKTIEDQKIAIKEAFELAKRANDQGYKRARDEIMKEQRAAVQAGDTERYDQLVEEAQALDAGRAEAPKAPAAPPPAQPAPPAPEPEIADFMAQNRWFNTDEFLTRQMVNKFDGVKRRSPGMSLADQLDTALEALQDEFPEMFNMAPKKRQAVQEDPDPAPRRRASVTPPSGRQPPAPPRRGAIDSIADATERKEVRDAFARAKRQMPDLTEEDYMDIYSDPRADVLELQRAKRKGSK